MSAENQTVREIRKTQTHVNSDESAIVIGNSPQMQKVWDSVKLVAEKNTTVLITGETGVGKDIAAQKIHNMSPRKDKPFKAVNCGAFDRNLLKNELFGHEDGGFTGATNKYLGVFEEADGGTLFLDEVGEMSLEVQVEFLRVLETQVFRRLGGKQDIKVDVRIIAATNADIEADVQQKKFREDLYYRLDGFRIAIPPLRDRKNDIEDFVDQFICKLNEEHEKKIIKITPEALECLKGQYWKGNVRELRSTLDNAFIQMGKNQPEALELEYILKVLNPENPMDVRVPSRNTDNNLKDVKRAFDEVMNVLENQEAECLPSLEDTPPWTPERLSSWAIYYVIDSLKLKKPGVTIDELTKACGVKRNTYNSHVREFKRIDETQRNKLFARIKKAVSPDPNSTGEEKRNTQASPDTEARFAALEARFAALEARFAALEKR